MFITYNGINLALTTIDNVQRDSIMSEDGATLLYVETTISVSAVYAPPTGNTPNIGGTSVGGFFRNLSRPPAQPAPIRNPADVAGSNPFTGITLRAPLNNIPTPPTSRGAPFGVTGSALEPRFAGNFLQTNLQPVFTFNPPLLTSGVDPDTYRACTLPNPGVNGWAGPIQTDRELEVRLRQPRKKLLVWGFRQNGAPLVWIESPKNQNPSDAKNGPIVLGCHVKPGPNSNSFFVAMDIRTWLTPTADASDRALLSHRWRMRHTENEAHYLSREVTGEAVFNLGVLAATGQSPDWFREQLFHPIPLGFQRSLGPIEMSMDGTTLYYSYTDTDTTVVFDPADTDAASMEIIEKVQYHNPWRGVS